MRFITTASAVIFVLSIALAQGEQGGFGGGIGGGGFGGGQGGFGGAQGGQGGMDQQIYDRSTQAISQAIGEYITTQPVKNILTPEGFSEWTLKLKSGQVVIAEAWSDAFDPMLEVTDDKAKVLATSDDRYPGDQRPLLLWRCEKDGTYSLRGRSFRDKAGGQFFLRYEIYDSIDLSGNDFVEKEFGEPRMLARVPMKAGEIKRVLNDPSGQYGYTSWRRVISPIGLPDIGLAAPFETVVPGALYAPVAGDYYLLLQQGGSKVRLRAEQVPIKPLAINNGIASAGAPANEPSIWEVDVKKGDVLEFALSKSADPFGTSIYVIEKSDAESFDIAKPELNPFFPKPANAEQEKERVISKFRGRARDGRITVTKVWRDATLLVVTRGRSGLGRVSINIRPAPQDYVASQLLSGKLTIGSTDYWVFDAQVGDVMKFASEATGFASHISVLDPELREVTQIDMPIDHSDLTWDFFATKPGRYLVAMSAIGDGGAGDYTLERKTYAPREFGVAVPAEDKLGAGDVHVWKLTAKPGEPLLVRWSASNFSYSSEIRTSEGKHATMGLTQTGEGMRHGVLTVQQPTTFLIVLRGGGMPTDYKIEVTKLN